MPADTIFDLFITDQQRNVILEERAVNFKTAERIIREYSWSTSPRSHAQLWKRNSKFSLSIHYVDSVQKFEVGFSDKASRFKLPLPYIGATYGHLGKY